MARQTLTITEHMSELIYDIQNKTYLTGRSRSNGENHEEVANMQANDDDENINQVVRSIGNAFSTLKTKLSEYLAEEGQTSDDKLMSTEGDLTLSLTMPCNYNQSTRDTIATEVHQYIVNISVADWFNITNKNDAKDYYTMASANVQTIREAINKRKRPQRKSIE